MMWRKGSSVKILVFEVVKGKNVHPAGYAHYTRHPAGYLFLRIWFTSLPKPMGYPSAQRRCQPFLWAASDGSMFRVSPLR